MIVESSTIAQVRELFGSALSITLTHGAQLNTDDTDLLQYTFKHFLDRCSNSQLHQILTAPDALLGLLKVLDAILSTHKKMINLVKYLVELLGRTFENAPTSPAAEEKLLFFRIAQRAFEENKENTDLVKDLIAVAPHFIAK